MVKTERREIFLIVSDCFPEFRLSLVSVRHVCRRYRRDNVPI